MDWIAITAVGTWALVLATWWMVWKQSQTSRNELKVKLQMSLEDRFESSAMIAKRKRLAAQLLMNAPHEQIQEDIMNFFESVGVLLRRGYLDKEMAWVGFGYYGIRWWNACKDYILEERRRKGGDQTIFAEFQYLVDKLYEVETKQRGKTRSEVEPGKTQIQIFLEEERDL
jgi:hypothetical protein